MKSFINFLEKLISVPAKAVTRIVLKRIEQKEKEARAWHEKLLQRMRDDGASDQEISETDNQFNQIVNRLKQEEKDIRESL